MTIREATQDDIEAIINMGEAMHAESPRFAPYPFSRGKAERLARSLICDADGILLVAERDDELIGMMAGLVTEHFFSSAACATDFVLYVQPGLRGGSAAPRLIQTFEEAAKARGAADVAPGISTGVAPDQTRALYEKLGYTAVGYTMVKAI